jgi:hypothetical protein
MLRTRAQAAAMRRAQHHRHAALTAKHEVGLGRLVDQRIHRQRHEIHEHDFNYGLEAAERGANGGGNDRGFGNRRIAHALRAESIQQAAGGLERAAGTGNILSQQYDARIGLHAVAQRQRDRLYVAHFDRAHCDACFA